MTFAPVGIKCPDHAGVGASRPRQAPQQTVRSAQRTIAGLDAPATVALVAINVVIYMITVYQGAGIAQPGGKLFLDGALVGYAIDEGGEWYRLVTAMFLHAGLIHLDDIPLADDVPAADAAEQQQLADVTAEDAGLDTRYAPT